MALIYSQNFDGVIAPALPTGSTSTSAVLTSTTQFHSSPNALTTTGDSAALESWFPSSSMDGASGNVVVSSWLYFVGTGNVLYQFARSSTQSFNTATAYCIEFAPTGVVLSKSASGALTHVSSVIGNGQITTGIWYNLVTTYNGTAISATVQRASDSNYLNASGAWQPGSTNAISVTDSSISGQGYFGMGFYTSATNQAFVDDYAVNSVVTTTTIPANDSHIRYSPEVARVSGSTVILQEQATKAEFGFTGTTLAALVSVANLQSISLTSASWPNLYAVIDGGSRLGPFQITAPGSGTTQTVALASGLSAGTHQAVVYYEEISGQDTYNQALNVPLTGFVIDSGGTVSAPTSATLPNAIIFGDSITWGSQALPVNQNPFYQGYAYLMGGLLGVDLGIVGKPGQGLVNNNSGSPIASGPFGKDSYKKYDSADARTFLQNLKYCMFAWGTNDTTDITSQVTATTIEARGLIGSTCAIIWLIPIAGSHASQIIAGVAAAGDPLAVAVASGVAYTGAEPAQSNDGTHPNATYHSLEATGYANAITAAFSTLPTDTPTITFTFLTSSPGGIEVTPAPATIGSETVNLALTPYGTPLTLTSGSYKDTTAFGAPPPVYYAWYSNAYGNGPITTASPFSGGTGSGTAQTLLLSL